MALLEIVRGAGSAFCLYDRQSDLRLHTLPCAPCASSVDTAPSSFAAGSLSLLRLW